VCGLGLLLFRQPAIHVLTPIHDAAAEAEAVRPDAEMAPVAQCRHRRAEYRGCLCQGQQLSRRVGVIVGHDRYLRACGDSMGASESAAHEHGRQLALPVPVPRLLALL
jgi:hypothetical protein